jgi:hypothetical protein
MNGNNPRISLWVLVLEMLCCFTPLTLLCIAIIANLGRMEGTSGIVALTVAATGPVGLFVAFKVVVLNRRSLTRSSTAALSAIAAWTALIYSLHIFAEGQPADAWREFVLIVLLPGLGIVHLLHLTRPSIGKPVAGPFAPPM